jgi:hypothetical protein
MPDFGVLRMLGFNVMQHIGVEVPFRMEAA